MAHSLSARGGGSGGNLKYVQRFYRNIFKNIMKIFFEILVRTNLDPRPESPVDHSLSSPLQVPLPLPARVLRLAAPLRSPPAWSNSETWPGWRTGRKNSIKNRLLFLLVSLREREAIIWSIMTGKGNGLCFSRQDKFYASS